MIDFSRDDESVRLLNEIDEVCDRYEAAWKAGENPRIEDFLAGERDDLILDLIPYLVEIEVAYRRKHASTISSERDQETEISVDSGVASTPQSPQRTIPEHSELLLPSRFDRFELLELVGSGATSAVYKAIDSENGATVAIKMCHAFLLEDRVARLRFLREAASTAKLRCDGIVHVREFGCYKGKPFLVMEFVEGETLGSRLKRCSGAQDPMMTARIVAQAAKALSHAHDAGVFHRDIKPSNLLLLDSSVAAKRPVEAIQLKIADFGLARMDESITQMTRTGEVLGTPTYMSPETIAEGANHADARSDVYSLGVVLYQMLTGQVPFAKPMPAIMQQILLESPVAPRQVCPSIPRPLELICLKCLEKNPAGRFQSAAELEQELSRWIAGESIVTRPDSALAIAYKLVRRHRGYVILGALLIIVGFLSLYLVNNEAAKAQESVAKQKIVNIWKANGPALREAIEVAKSDAATIRQIEQELANGGLTPKQELRLRLTTSSSQLGDITHLAGYIAFHSDPYELDALSRIYGEKTKEILDQSQPSPDDKVHLEFRRALLLPRSSTDESVNQILDEQVAWGFAHLDTPERITHWATLVGEQKPNVSRKLIELLNSNASEQEKTLACQTLVEFNQDDPQMLVEAIEFAEGAQHQALVKSLLPRAGIALELLERRLAVVNPRQRAISTSADAGGDQEQYWRNCSRILIAMARLRSDQVVKVLADMPLSEPRLNTYFTSTASTCGLELSYLDDQLPKTNNTSALRSLILTLGNYSEAAFDSEPALLRWLQSQYADHPSAAVHAAIRWVLRKQGRTAWLAVRDQELIGKKKAVAEWFVNSQGITMVALPASVLPVQLAISMEEITIADYRAFRPDHRFRKDCLGISPEHPASNVSAIAALDFCLWLTASDGIAAEEQCVRRLPNSEAINIDLTRRGYRLPTMLELTRASQAGAMTPLFFGGPETPFPERFVFAGKKPSSASVGRRLPNAFGLFDTLGNVYEWSLDDSSGTAEEAAGKFEEGISRLVKNQPLRMFGGEFGLNYEECRPLPGSRSMASEGFSHIGFRVVCRAPDELRTVPQ